MSNKFCPDCPGVARCPWHPRWHVFRAGRSLKWWAWPEFPVASTYSEEMFNTWEDAVRFAHAGATHQAVMERPGSVGL